MCARDWVLLICDCVSDLWQQDCMSCILLQGRNLLRSYLWTKNCTCLEAALLLPFLTVFKQTRKAALSSNWQTKTGLNRYLNVSERLEEAQNVCEPGWLRTHIWCQSATQTCQCTWAVLQCLLEFVFLVQGGPRWLCLQSYFFTHKGWVFFMRWILKYKGEKWQDIWDLF